MLAYTTYYPYSSKPEDNYIRNAYDNFDYNLYLNVFTQKGYMNTFKAYLEKNNIKIEKTDQEEEILNNIKVILSPSPTTGQQPLSIKEKTTVH